MSATNRHIKVKNTAIAVKSIAHTDYLNLTDMVKNKDGAFFVADWLRNRNTLEFLSIWESINNPHFNRQQSLHIRHQAGLNSFKISVNEWTRRTGAIGLFATAGRYGGTYAQKDIAFEFGMWIDPAFKLYLIREYERLKAIENNQYNLEWNVRRVISKVNYSIHTSAIRQHLVDTDTLPLDEQLAYADEADLINLALFGQTATKWRKLHPELAQKGDNIRDSASINELIVLSNLESENAILIKSGQDKETRFLKLKKIAHDQLRALAKNDPLKRIKKTSDATYFNREQHRRQQEVKQAFAATS